MNEICNDNLIIHVAEAKKRNDRVWKDHGYTWSGFVQRLGSVVRTPETEAEYQKWKSSDDPQERMKADQAKDVGGFVGGTLKDGLRKKDHVLTRTLICLDLDNADDNVWSDWQGKFGFTAVLYSTHSHTAEKPRLRLVIPLAKEILPDMYEPIALKIIEQMGEKRFDPTTAEVNRFMYWASCPCDGEFVFKVLNDTPLLDGEEFLKQHYANWKDQTTWPVLSGSSGKVGKEVAQKKQTADQKAGWVGAFCQAYTIHEAIAAFVPDYERSEDCPDRYSYVKGTTYNGVVTYDDQFSYSHHATDPAGGVLQNAFDLVRIHKFGYLDAGKPNSTALTNLPSYKAMLKLCQKDTKCRVALVGKPKAAGNVPLSSTGSTSSNWMADLALDEDGSICMTHPNVRLILNNDPELKGIFGFDEFAQRISLVGDAPWPRRNSLPIYTDSDDNQLISLLDERYGLRNPEIISRSMETVADENIFHPVRQYLDGLDEWDGVKRIDTIFPDYFNAKPSDYASAVLRKTLIGAVKRAYEPGCKHDTMLVLRGNQGQGKSTFIRILATRDDWFTDHLVGGIGSKDSREGLLGKWLIEIAELVGMKKTDVEIIKNFISTQVDHLRVPYGRRSGSYPRGCVFFGTTNESSFLNDETGGRRFWIVDVRPVDGKKPRKDLFKDLPLEVPMIWSEAVALYMQGESTVLEGELLKEAKSWQDRFQYTDPTREAIEEYLETLLPAEWDKMDIYARLNWLRDPLKNTTGTQQRQVVCVREIVAEALGKPKDEVPDKWDSNKIRNIVENLNNDDGDRWEYMGSARLDFPIYGRQRYFQRLKRA